MRLINSSLRSIMSAGASPRRTADPQPTAEPKPRRGRCAHIYLHAEDEQRLRHLVTFISRRGYRISDSQAIAAALRSVEPGDEFMRAFREVQSQDLRFRG